MVRTNQGGSVLGFIVVGVVLVALFVGGAYTVHQLSAQPEVAPAQPEQAPPKSRENKDDSSKDQPQKTDNQPAKPQQNPAGNSSQSPAAELPQTGPAELLGTLLALGLLSATAVSYARSRRPELSL